MLGPFLGRSSPATGEFEPVLDPAAGGDRALESLTVLCVSGGTPAGDRSSLARTVATLDGDEVHRFGDVPVALPGGEGVRCRRVVDSLDALKLPPGRYEISAVARSPSFVTEAETAEFTLGSGPVEPGGTAR